MFYTSDVQFSSVTEQDEANETCDLEEDEQLLSHESLCFTTPGHSTRDSDEEFSTNQDGTNLTSKYFNKHLPVVPYSGETIFLLKSGNYGNTTVSQIECYDCANFDWGYVM